MATGRRDVYVLPMKKSRPLQASVKQRQAISNSVNQIGGKQVLNLERFHSCWSKKGKKGETKKKEK